MPTLRICIDGMQCVADEERVEQLLAKERGVFGAVADHKEDCVDVDYEDDEASLVDLLNALKAEGFGASLGG
jgi:copper chaperone CopZ